MRSIRHMLFGQRLESSPPAAATPPPAPAGVSDREHDELARARDRLEPKWRTVDDLLADFRAGDTRLRSLRR